MKHQCLRRYFHNNIFQSCVRHLTERFLYDIRFWCCIDGWNSLISDDCLNRSDQSCLLSCMFEDCTDHIRCCCLSFGSCDTDRCQLFCWISKYAADISAKASLVLSNLITVRFSGTSTSFLLRLLPLQVQQPVLQTYDHQRLLR